MDELPVTVNAFDVETTMKCPVGENKANPFWPENKVVMSGLVRDGLKEPVIVNHCCTMKRGKAGEIIVVAGQNIGFDLSYVFREATEKEHNYFNTEVGIWDTQLAAYLLSGQQHRWASLDELAVQYGLPVKDNTVSAMFEAGKGADEIPTSILKPYLETDLTNTLAIAKTQMKEAVDKAMMPLCLSQMNALKATIEMKWNGLAIDKEFLIAEGDRLSAKRKELAETMQAIAKHFMATELDPSSPTQLSKILFGGKIKVRRELPIGHYKNGKEKTKVVYEDREIGGWLNGMPIKPEWRGKHVVSVDESVLKAALKWIPTSATPVPHTVVQLVESVLEWRELDKQINTYFDGMLALIMPDGRIHHSLNHCATVTGRLSSSEPNMQNIPKDSSGGVKTAFVSRWGDDGVILEADYKQLEMVALAIVTGDRQLTADISAGVDIHTELFRSMHGRTPTDDERWWFKRCSFALVYGGGPQAIADQGNCTKEEAKKFIEVFYTRYPGVKTYHEQVVQWADLNRVYEGDKDAATGLPYGKAYYRSMTGRLYVFREYANSPEIKKWKKKDMSFSPTQLKNYSVQGTATGDLVPLVLGKLLYVLKNNPRLANHCLLINTVHDSVLFDVHKDVLEESKREIKRVMENAHAYMEETFGIKWPIKLRVEMSSGPNWGEQKKEDV